MNKAFATIVALDIAVLTLPSALLGLALYFVQVPFWTTFLLSFVGLGVAGSLSNKIIGGNTERITKKLENETAKLIASQTISVKCAYCGTINSMLFKTDSDMVFDCTSCKQKNSVVLQIGVARTTTPLNMKTPSEELISDAQIDSEKE